MNPASIPATELADTWARTTFLVFNFLFAALGWTALGRLLLSVWLPEASGNYIWRFFRLITDWPLKAVRIITPSYIPDRLLPAFLAFWCFLMRWVALAVSVGLFSSPGAT